MHFALFSGGHDSVVSTHYLMENGYCDKVLHMDTNTGIPANKEYVRNICKKYNWPLRVETAPITLKELATEYGSGEPFGFPSAKFHPLAYRMLKERSLSAVATELDEKPHYWTGVRKSESDRRMKTVSDAVNEVKQWTWHAPIRNWTQERCEEYIDKWDIPRNEVVENIHRSGECFCGAFATRDEALIDLQANYPEHYEWLIELEEEVISEIGQDHERAYWANGSLSGSDKLHLDNKYLPDEDMVLCRDCKLETYNDATDW